MLFCQLGWAHSLREICGGLAPCLGKLTHLGIERAPVRLTLAYANSPLGFVDPKTHLYPKRFYRLMDAAGVALMEQPRWQGGQFHLNLVGELGRTVVVEASTNPADWPPIATNVLGSDPILFTDPQSGVFKHRFYRLRWP